MQNQDGTLAQWIRYSAFGDQILSGDPQLSNPWRYANRREIANLILFAHRLYNPRLMRWQTPDPLGFKDGLNLYHYVHNNPFIYRDRDGRTAVPFPIVFEVIKIAFGAGATATFLPAVGITIGVALVAYGSYQLCVYASNQFGEADPITPAEEVDDQNKGRKKGKDNAIKGGPPRDPATANYLPDPAAEVTPHTTLGTKQGRHGPYTQGATFDENVEFTGRTDVTDHGRKDHNNPHFHPATGPNAANSPGMPITEWFWRP